MRQTGSVHTSRLLLILLALLLGACGDDDNRPRATPTATVTRTATASPSPTPTTTAPPTATSSPTPTASATPPPTDTASPSPTATRDPLALPALRAAPDVERGGRIVDADGREVLLRGANVNAYAEYWQGSDFPTVFPLAEEDPQRMAAIGWNAVRLLLSWSRVEPSPGAYDEAYLATVRDGARRLVAAGLYVILDLHQDAWGPTLAARIDEPCGAGELPAFGWDGAPGWATLDEGKPRCALAGVRELSPAVLAAFANFFADAPGPGGVGVRTRYARMLGHLAQFFATEPGIAGYDLINEPNAFNEAQEAGLSALYGDALAAIRAGERAGGGAPRLVFFEPSAVWSLIGGGAPPDFARDADIVYAPHIYAGGIDPRPLDATPFQTARDEAALFGGAPVLVGEWGGDPHRAADPQDDYFLAHQRLQDQFAVGATLWTWRESCGDPHKMGDLRAGTLPQVWGEFEVDCTSNTVTGLRQPLIDQLTRAYVRAAPGQLDETNFDPSSGALVASGSGAPAGAELIAFFPAARFGAPGLSGSGLSDLRTLPAPGGNLYILATARGGAWELHAAPVP
ncbi:MAG: cellulase family glycosylhydrolase [Deltaproteobacteria bacterium]|nr:cellulase family glycosylhydrolase [Deltaproteobacteria bacterium]